MKEAVLIGSYSNEIEKEVTLINTILDWKKFNIPIILTTHYPESEKVQELVDYYIFDKNQYMDDRLIVNQFYGCDKFRIDAPANRQYHAAAAMISYQNAVRAFGDKFDMIYLQDYDVQLNKKEALDIIRSLSSSNFQIFMMNWKGDQNAYATNVWMFKPEIFNKIWKNLQSVDDYLDLVNSTPQQHIFIEHLMKNLINSRNLQQYLYLFDEKQKETLIQNFSFHTADINEPRIYMCSTTTGSAILFLVNPEGSPLWFRIQTKNLINGRETDRIQGLEGRISMYWSAYENVYVKVTCNDIERSYYVTPYNTFKECTFQFFDGTSIIAKK